MQQQATAQREIEAKLRAAAAAKAKTEREAIAANQSKIAAELARKNEAEARQKIENEAAVAAALRTKTATDATRIGEQRMEAEKRLMDAAKKRKDTEEAALLSVHVQTQQAEAGLRMAIEKTTIEKATSAIARQRAEAENTLKQTTIQRAEKEKTALAYEKSRADSEVAAQHAVLATVDAKQQLARFKGERKDFAAKVSTATTKIVASNGRQTTSQAAPAWLVMVVALIIGAGAGYLARAPSDAIDAQVSPPTAARSVATRQDAAIIPARSEDEPVIALRLDRSVESLSRLPAGSDKTSTDKKP